MPKKRTPRSQQQHAWSAASQDDDEEAAVEEGRVGIKQKQPRGTSSESSAGFLFDWVLAPLTGLFESSPRGMAGKAGGADTTDQSAVTLESIEDQDLQGADAKTTTTATMAGPSSPPSNDNKSGGGARGGGRSGGGGGGRDSAMEAAKDELRANAACRRRSSSRGRTVRAIHEQYETSPFVVWFGMVTKLVGLARVTGLALVTGLAPVTGLARVTRVGTLHHVIVVRQNTFN